MKLKIDLDRKDIQMAIVDYVREKYGIEVSLETIRFDITDNSEQTSVRAYINA